LGELYTNYFYNLYGLPIVNARFFNSYGPGEVPGKYRNVIPNFFYWALNKEPLPITGTGDETRDFTYVDDTVRGFMKAGEADGVEGRVINLGMGEEVSVGELARMIIELVGRKVRVEVDEQRLRPERSEVRRLVSDNRLARELIGWQPEVGLEDGLRRTIEWVEKHIELYEPDRYAF